MPFWPSCLFLLFCPFLLRAADLPDLRALAKEARPSVYLLLLQDEDGKTIGSGTGFAVSAEGLLITNQHVVAEAKSIIAKAENGGLFPVTRVLSVDSLNDLALLQLQAKNLPFLSLAPSGWAETGTRVAVIGSPLGLEGTLSEGIVSARRRLPQEKRDVLQISAPISQGSSGSPILDAQGRVVGVASFLLENGQSPNFATPSEKIRPLLAKFTASSQSEIHPIVSSPKTDTGKTYQVKSGDTLTKIVRDLQKQGLSTTAEAIRTLNQLPTNSVIRPGQNLKIPDSAHP